MTTRIPSDGGEPADDMAQAPAPAPSPAPAAQTLGQPAPAGNDLMGLSDGPDVASLTLDDGGDGGPFAGTPVPQPVRVAQAPTGTMTDAEPRLDDFYRMAQRDRTEREALDWFYSQTGGPPQATQPAAPAPAPVAPTAAPEGEPRPGIITPEMEEQWRQTNRAILSDIGRGLPDIWHWLVGGGLLAGRSAASHVDDLAAYIKERTGADFRTFPGLGARNVGQWDPNAPVTPLRDRVPNPMGAMDTPDTVTASILQKVTQFGATYYALGRLGLRGNPVDRFGQQFVRASAAEYLGFEGAEQNFADLILAGEGLLPEGYRGIARNAVTEWLTNKEGENEVLSRLKNTVAAAPLNIALPGILHLSAGWRNERLITQLTGSQNWAEARQLLKEAGMSDDALRTMRDYGIGAALRENNVDPQEFMQRMAQFHAMRPPTQGGRLRPAPPDVPGSPQRPTTGLPGPEDAPPAAGGAAPPPVPGGPRPPSGGDVLARLNEGAESLSRRVQQATDEFTTQDVLDRMRQGADAAASTAGRGAGTAPPLGDQQVPARPPSALQEMLSRPDGDPLVSRIERQLPPQADFGVPDHTLARWMFQNMTRGEWAPPEGTVSPTIRPGQVASQAETPSANLDMVRLTDEETTLVMQAMLTRSRYFGLLADEISRTGSARTSAGVLDIMSAEKAYEEARTAEQTLRKRLGSKAVDGLINDVIKQVQGGDPNARVSYDDILAYVKGRYGFEGGGSMQAAGGRPVLAFKEGGPEEKFILANYKKMGIAQLAEKLGYSRRVVEREIKPILQRAGIEQRGPGGAVQRNTDRDAAIEAMYRDGVPLAEIGREHGLSSEGVANAMRRLRDAGRDIPNRYGARHSNPDDVIEQVLDRIAQGKTHDQVAAELGMTRGKVAGILYRARRTEDGHPVPQTLLRAIGGADPTLSAHWEKLSPKDRANIMADAQVMPSHAVAERIARKVQDAAVAKGETVKITDDVLRDVERALEPYMGLVPRDTDVGLLQEIKPLDKTWVQLTFKGINGPSKTVTVVDRWANHSASRAFFDSGLDGSGNRVRPMFIGIVRRSAPLNESASDAILENFNHSLSGELSHELTHRLFSRVDDPMLRTVLLHHAKVLKVLDTPVVDYLVHVGREDMIEPNLAGYTLRDFYQVLYHNNPYKDSWVEEEGVAAMVEMRHRGVFNREQLERITPDIEALLVSAMPSRAPSGAKPSGDIQAAAGGWMPDVGGAFERMVDRIQSMIIEVRYPNEKSTGVNPTRSTQADSLLIERAIHATPFGEKLRADYAEIVAIQDRVDEKWSRLVQRKGTAKLIPEKDRRRLLKELEETQNRTAALWEKIRQDIREDREYTQLGLQHRPQVGEPANVNEKFRPTVIDGGKQFAAGGSLPDQLARIPTYEEAVQRVPDLESRLQSLGKSSWGELTAEEKIEIVKPETTGSVTDQGTVHSDGQSGASAATEAVSDVSGLQNAAGGSMPPLPPGGTPPAPPASGQPPGRGNFSREFQFNWGAVESQDQVKAMAGQMMDTFRDELVARGVSGGGRGHVQSWKATADKAGMLNAVEMLFEQGKSKGMTYDASGMEAMGNLYVSSMENLKALVAKAAGPDATPEDMVAMRHQITVHRMVQAEFWGGVSEAGRTLNILKKVKGASQEYERGLNEIIQGTGGLETNRALAEAIADYIGRGDYAGADRMIEKSATAKTLDAITEIWKGGLLRGPFTHVVNFLGNASVIPYSIVERAVAGMIGNVISPVDGVKIGEAAAMATGIRMAMREAVAAFAESFRTGQQVFGQGQTEQQMFAPRTSAEGLGINVPSTMTARGQTGDLARFGALLEGQTYAEMVRRPETALGLGLDLISTYVTAGFRSLGAADSFFKVLNNGAELMAQAVRQANQELLRGEIAEDAFRARVGELYENPTEAMRMAAKDFAEYNTFTNEPGPITQKLEKLREWDHPVAKFAGHVILPFVRTPGNLMNFSFAERTPLALATRQFWREIDAGGDRANMALAKMGLGTIILMVALDLAIDGHITGTGPQDPRQRELWLRNGWRPMSVRIPRGTKPDGTPEYVFVPLQRLDPIASIPLLGAELAEVFAASPNRPPHEFNDTFFTGAFVISELAMNKPTMQGFSNIMKAITQRERFAESWGRRTVASFVPADLAYVTNRMDPTMRQTWDIVSALKARTPGLSQTLPPSLDFWGRERTRVSGLGDAFDAVSPIFARTNQDSQPIDRELGRLGFYPTHPRSLPVLRSDAAQRALDGIPQRRGRNQRGIEGLIAAQPEDPVRGESNMVPTKGLPLVQNQIITLTANTPASKLIRDNEERLVAAGRTSAITRLSAYGNKTLREVLNDLVENNTDYRNARDDQRRETIQDILRDFRTAASAQVVAEFPELRQRRDAMRGRHDVVPAVPF